MPLRQSPVLLAPSTHPTCLRSRLRRLRRTLALLVAGVLAFGCVEPIVEAAAGSLAEPRVSIAAIQGAAHDGADTTAARPTAAGRGLMDVASDPRPAPPRGPTPAPAPDAHVCPCTHALVVTAGVPQVPAPETTATARRARPRADRLPPEPAPEPLLRPPATPA